MLTFYILHCNIRLKILKINIDNISQKCSVHNTGRKGILLLNGEVPRHIRQEDETVVLLPPLHEWTSCEGWCNCSCSRMWLSKQGAIFEPVVSHLICSCDASNQWDTTGEEFCQSGITSFPCRIYLSVAVVMFQICFIQLWLILIICDCNKCIFISGKSTNNDQLWNAGRAGEYGHTVNWITFCHKSNVEGFLHVLFATNIRRQWLNGLPSKIVLNYNVTRFMQCTITCHIYLFVFFCLYTHN